jgi:soluble lytic murein transglycosylase
MTRRLALLVVLGVGAVTALVYLQNPKTPDFLDRLRYPLRYEAIVRGHSRNYGIEPALLAAVIYQESKFDPNAESKSGAIGLMQLTPPTARGIAIRTGGAAFRIADLRNPEINVRYGSWYLQHLFRKYGDERLVLAAYNAGQGNVDRWRARGQEIQFAETRHYVDRVEELKRIYRDAYASELGYSR